MAALGMAHAAEEIVLQNGFRISAERHESHGEILTVHTAGGTLEIRSSDVASIEELETVAQVAPSQPVPSPEGASALKPTGAEKQKTARDHLQEAADRLGLPREFLLSIARAESAFQPNVVSNKGAIGVMQLMPGTAKELQVDPYDTRQNIEGGARLMRDLLLKYQNYPDQVYRALSAYNAGAGAVQRYNGIPPYRETRQYIEKVLGEYNRLRTQQAVSR